VSGGPRETGESRSARTERTGVHVSGVDRSGVDHSGVDRSGGERIDTERSGTRRSGGERPVPERDGGEVFVPSRGRTAPDAGLDPGAPTYHPGGRESGDRSWHPAATVDQIPRPVEPEAVGGEQVYVIYRPDAGAEESSGG